MYDRHPCSAEDRADRQNVYFKLISCDEKEETAAETTTVLGVTIQRLTNMHEKQLYFIEAMLVAMTMASVVVVLYVMVALSNMPH